MNRYLSIDRFPVAIKIDLSWEKGRLAMPQDRLDSLVVNSDGFVFDPSTGDSYVINSTSAFILSALQDGLDESRIVQLLVETFDVTEAEASRDLADFLLRLHAMQLA